MLDQMSQKMKQNDKGEMQFKVSANNTGKTQHVAGFEAREIVLKMELEGTDTQSGQKGSMVITTDMWIAPAVPGYSEVRDFYRRMAEKLDGRPAAICSWRVPGKPGHGRSLQGDRQARRYAGAGQNVTMGAEETGPPVASSPGRRATSAAAAETVGGRRTRQRVRGRFRLGRKKPAPRRRSNRLRRTRVLPEVDRSWK